MTDPFFPTDFGDWADSYDDSIRTESIFPFDGYEQVLDTIVLRAGPRPGMTVLDIGTGTGNLALRFAELGCKLWCTDFSRPMLEKARAKLPDAHFIAHDFRTDLPLKLGEMRFDLIVSAYVFHHVELPEKLEICRSLVRGVLNPEGRLVIGDLSFQSQAVMDAFARSIPDIWEVEPYWLVDGALPALKDARFLVDYDQVSACAGVYKIQEWMAVG